MKIRRRKTKVTIKIKLPKKKRLSFETPLMRFIEICLGEGRKFSLKKSFYHYLIIEPEYEDFRSSEDFDIKDIISHEEEV